MNLRNKPRKRLVRERPEPLAVPEAINAAVNGLEATRDSTLRLQGTHAFDVRVLRVTRVALNQGGRSPIRSEKSISATRPPPRHAGVRAPFATTRAARGPNVCAATRDRGRIDAGRRTVRKAPQPVPDRDLGPGS